MRFSRARYVTLCQQSLVTAAVLAVGVSAAGVKTLDIVPQPGHAVGVRGDVPRALPQQTLAENREAPARTKVDAAPVTPKVREVKVSGISNAGTGATAEPTPSPAPNARLAPKRSQSRSQSHESQSQESQSGSAGAAEAGKRLVALSDPQPVKGYATVGVTWKHGVDYADDQIDIQVRTEKNGAWSSWMAAEYHDEHGPDGAEGGDAGERPGTDALVIGDVDRVQMRAETTDGTTPPDLKLAVIDPGTGAMVEQAPAIDTSKLGDRGAARTTKSQDAPQALSSTDGEVQDSVALSAMKVAPKPYIYSRAQWGANEKMRDQSAPSYGTIKAGFIHHTVNANNYTADQVPSLLRGIYAYHTQSRGWRDVGYNFLVDRFGRIWEGRWGGVDRPVVGAHTLGYNEVAFAMSAIGNFDTANPPQAVSDAYARLFAWKLSMYNIRADASRIYVKNRYMQAINGHRDVGQTACPGRYLYAKIPAIRVATQRLQDAAQSGTTTTPPKPAPTPTPTPTPNPDTFTSPTQTPRPATTQPSGIVFPRSLNLAGDANPELVLKSSAGAVQVFPTGGQTGYRPAVSTPGNWAITNLVAAVGDVTGDGRGDVLARTSKDRVTRVYAGDGAGHFKTSGIAATKAFQWANMLQGAGDWNRDGRNDVLMRDTGTGWLWMFPGRGAGLFGSPTLLSKSWKNIRSTAVVGDVSGDGRPDLAAIHRNGGFYVALSTSTGGITGFQKRGQFGTRFNALLGGARDLTGDAYGDLVVRSAQNGQLSILVGRRGGYFSNVLGPFDGGAGLNQISSGQAAGSAQPDVVGLNKAGTELVVVPHNGLTNLRPALPGNLTRTDVTQLLNVGDWNRDGRGDLITRQTVGDSLVLRPGLANGQFGNGVVMSRGWKPFTNLAAVGDVTGDKLPDLVGRTKTGKTTIFPGNGATGFKAPVVAPNFLKAYNQVGEGAWKPQYLPGSAYIGSDGAFVPFMGSGAGDLAGYDWVIGPGDVDGDGRNDLVVRDSAGNLWLLPGTATGYATRRLIAAGFSSYTLGG